jgi:arginase
MNSYQLIEAPSILGLKPTGVELLPYALQRNGFLAQTSATPIAVPIDVTEFRAERVSPSDVRNATALARYTRRLAAVLEPVLARGQFPIVVGGDCSILLGCVLALRKQGRYGLAHVDAHADFYQPEAERNGEAASMDLALATGHGPSGLTDLDGLKPYVREEDAVQLGQRDADEAAEAGSQRIQDTRITCFDLATIRAEGITRIAERAVSHLERPARDGFWIHFDTDVLADELLPAVDYRLPGGLTFEEAADLLQVLVHVPKAVGLTITIFNPKLDPDGELTRHLVCCLHAGLGVAGGDERN